MKTVLALASILALSMSGASAMCGHDTVQSKSDQTVATLDTSTTASTVADSDVEPDTTAPAEAD